MNVVGGAIPRLVGVAIPLRRDFWWVWRYLGAAFAGGFRDTLKSITLAFYCNSLFGLGSDRLRCLTRFTSDRFRQYGSGQSSVSSMFNRVVVVLQLVTVIVEMNL